MTAGTFTETNEPRNGHAVGYSPPPATIADDAERAVLGAMLLGDVDDERLLPEHFDSEQNRKLFVTLTDMRGEGQQVDQETLRHELRRRDWLNDAGGVAGIIGVMEAVPLIDHIDTYATHVIDAAKRRRIIDVARKATIDAADASVDVEDIESRLHDVDDGNGTSRPAPMSLATLRHTHPQLRQPIIDGLVRVGETVNLIAPPKVGKS